MIELFLGRDFDRETDTVDPRPRKPAPPERFVAIHL
jgi:hypothetical protein